MVYLYKFIFNLILLCFVPMLCSLVLVVKCYAFSLSTLLDFISLMQFPCVVALVKCWTCKWYFALSLLACMSGCSLLVWMSIVVTIYSDCTFLVKPWFIALFHLTLSQCAYSICITSFLHTMIRLCYVSGDTCSYGSRVSPILELGMSEFF